MDSRAEARLKYMIGETAVALVLLQTQVEALTAENAELKAKATGKDEPAPAV